MSEISQVLAAQLVEWIEIDSVTGSEAAYADALARDLVRRGFDVEVQQVSEARANVLARAGHPEVVFCTHLDTVPPWFGASRDRQVVRGRGSCDAKGPALAMATAGELLLAEGEDRIGYLFTVGEEIDSIGAQHANAELARPDFAARWSPRYTIVGEPTENRFVRSHKGIFKGRLCAHGVAGHSSQPIGPSAVHELCAAIAALLQEDWGKHPLFGEGTLNFGRIEGGVAPNVVADRAQATLLLRAVEDPASVEQRIRRHLSEHVTLESKFRNYGPVEFVVPPDSDELHVAFGTDAPHLGRWGKPLLYGPGRILDAHTDHELCSLASLEQAVGDYAAVTRWLLAQQDAEAR